MNVYKIKGPYKLLDKYLIDKYGTVYRVKSNKELVKMAPFVTRDGYVEYVLGTKDGRQQHVQAHRLVAYTFLSSPKSKKHKYVNHKDGNRSNNDVKNLEWLTISENAKHSYRELGKVPWNKKT